jgi:hypothetical protein
MLNPPLSPILTGGLSVSLQCEQCRVYHALDARIWRATRRSGGSSTTFLRFALNYSQQILSEVLGRA